MALGQIPPWLDVTPGLFVGAMEGGARAGEAAASLDERKRSSGAEESLRARQLSQQADNQAGELALGNKKLDASLTESAADRVMKERLQTQQQKFQQNKFDTGTSLDLASLGVRNAALDLQKQKQNLAETKMAQDSQQKSAIDDDASSFWSDVASKTPPDELAQKHPLALKRKDIQQFLTQHAIADRQRQAVDQKQKTPQEKLELDYRTGRVLSQTVTGPMGMKLPGYGEQQKSGGPVKVTTQEDYDKLPPGTKYIDDSGKTKTKGAKSDSAVDAGTQSAYGE